MRTMSVPELAVPPTMACVYSGGSSAASPYSAPCPMPSSVPTSTPIASIVEYTLSGALSLRPITRRSSSGITSSTRENPA